jgi:hypothetical protein
MSTLLLEPYPAPCEDLERDSHLRLDGALLAGRADAHGRLTLDDLITGVWEGLAVRGTVNCPVCDSAMSLGDSDRGDREHMPVGACLNCGSSLY